ncbi:MAG: hypothetical protein J6Q55_00140, partial [Clostridia bacterium]|nr:hypothetical protein [Clostridia bacterium]
LEGGLLPTEQQPVDYTAPPQQPAQDTCPQDQQKQTPVCACQTAQESQPAPQQQEAVPSDSKRQPAQALCKAIDNQFATYSKVKAKTRNDSTTYYYKNKPLVRVQATDQSIKLSFTAGAVSVCSIRSEEDAVNFVDSLMSNQSAKK